MPSYRSAVQAVWLLAAVQETSPFSLANFWNSNSNKKNLRISSPVAASPGVQLEPIATTPSASEPAVTNPAPGTVGPKFYVVGDAPYAENQATKLRSQLQALSADADFLVHVGDMRYAGDGSKCDEYEYEDVAAVMKNSPVPVLMLVGDNDHNDCPNAKDAEKHWNNHLYKLENHWNHNLNVNYHSTRPWNWYFIRDGTLFIGLHIVSGKILDSNDWNANLQELAVWTKDLMTTHQLPTVLFGHANPTSTHDPYFTPVKNFIKSYNHPVMYMNGDQHQWMLTNKFKGVSNFRRITVNGLAKDPPVLITVYPDESLVTNAFKVDRRLS